MGKGNSSTRSETGRTSSWRAGGRCGQLDEEGNPIAILETNNDITERKRAEDALRQHADLLEQTHDAIIAWNFPGTIVYAGIEVRNTSTASPRKKRSAVSPMTFSGRSTRCPPRPSKHCSRASISGSGEMTHTTRDGRKVIVDSRHVLVEVAKGHRVVLETNRDITDRKRAEYLTGQVFESSPDAVSIVGRDYRYQQGKPGLRALLGNSGPR